MHTNKLWLWERQETCPGLHLKCIRVFAQNYYFPSTLIWKHSESCRKYSEPIRSTGYKKTLRSPVERLYKIPYLRTGAWTPAQINLQIKCWAKGSLTAVKEGVRVGAIKYTQSLWIHLIPISSSLCCDTQKHEAKETLQHLPVLLASSGRSGPSHSHNCTWMTLILPGFKVGNIHLTLD